MSVWTNLFCQQETKKEQGYCAFDSSIVYQRCLKPASHVIWDETNNKLLLMCRDCAETTDVLGRTMVENSMTAEEHEDRNLVYRGNYV